MFSSRPVERVSLVLEARRSLLDKLTIPRCRLELLTATLIFAFSTKSNSNYKTRSSTRPSQHKQAYPEPDSRLKDQFFGWQLLLSEENKTSSRTWEDKTRLPTVSPLWTLTTLIVVDVRKEKSRGKIDTIQKIAQPLRLTTRHGLVPCGWSKESVCVHTCVMLIWRKRYMYIYYKFSTTEPRPLQIESGYPLGVYSRNSTNSYQHKYLSIMWYYSTIIRVSNLFPIKESSAWYAISIVLQQPSRRGYCVLVVSQLTGTMPFCSVSAPATDKFALTWFIVFLSHIACCLLQDFWINCTHAIEMIT